MNNASFDIIGDIHGQARELETLLASLGYQARETGFRHPAGRRVIFLGDYIDRGPAIRRTLAIVRTMVETGDALAILGNHEVNALRFHATDRADRPLRPHTGKNVAQHAETLRQIPDAAEMGGWLRWLATLPLAIDLPGLRAVHACWDTAAVREMAACGPLTGETLERHSRKDTPAYGTISRIINGPEARLPGGLFQSTPDGMRRRDIRVKWWIELTGLSCREAVFPDSDSIPELPMEAVPASTPYDDACPVFFGHYALNSPVPAPITGKIACLDYGAGKGGLLCAYRWDGEQTLAPEKFVTVKTDICKNISRIAPAGVSNKA